MLKILANPKNLLFALSSLLLLLLFSGCEKKEDQDDDTDSYESVTIGDQVWMVKNLDVVTYRNGDPITLVTDSMNWINSTEGAYCNYNNDKSFVGDYGRLYNWHAVNDSRKLAPEGWHIPTNAEWQKLINYLGGVDEAGGKLKEAGLEHWVSPNTQGTNSSGFTALPGGFRSETDGTFSSMGGQGFWWLSSASSDGFAHAASLTTITGKAYSGVNMKVFGAYIRCIKD